MFRKGNGKTPPTPEQREAGWAQQDKELEQYCRFPNDDDKPPPVYEVVVPDLWKMALTYSSESSGRRAPKRSPKKTKSADKPPAQGKQRLCQQDVDDLTFYFEAFPSMCGLRSSWTEQAEAFGECARCGLRYIARTSRRFCPGCGHPRGQDHDASMMRVKSGQGSSWHPSLESDLLGVVMSKDMERANRVRDTLVRMVDRGYSKELTVLYRVYGERWPHAPFLRFGDLAQIVTYTATVEKAGKAAGLEPAEALERRLQQPGGDVFAEVVRMAAEKLLREASGKYEECKR